MSIRFVLCPRWRIGDYIRVTVEPLFLANNGLTAAGDVARFDPGTGVTLINIRLEEQGFWISCAYDLKLLPR